MEITTNEVDANATNAFPNKVSNSAEKFLVKHNNYRKRSIAINDHNASEICLRCSNSKD